MSAEEIISLSASVFNLRPAPRTKWEREYQAFQRLLPELLRTHRGQYVAIHEGKVVESGTDRRATIFRALAKVGGVDIHVGLVTEQPEPPIRIPHYRVVGEP